MIGNNTIVSIIPHVDDKKNGGVRRLDADECKVYHELMNKDCSSLFLCDHSTKQVLSRRCMLGQTVKLSSSLSVVRIALGADMVNDALGNRDDPLQMAFDIARVLEVDRVVVEKMYHLARVWLNRSDRVLNMKAIDNMFQQTSSPTKAIADLSLVSLALKELQSENLLNAMFYDLDAIDASCNSVKTSFSNTSGVANDGFLHCFAQKSCPLSYILHRYIQNGLGMECASITEVLHALECGCPPNKVVFDSPCKTIDEVRTAIIKGVNVNANSFLELEKIRTVCDELITTLGPSSISGVVGVRVNPLVGAGSIAELSVATASSKFGIPLTADNRKIIIDSFITMPYLAGVMCHVGSQGMPIDLLALGAKSIFLLANEVDSACGAARINMIDMGEGLSANYDSDVVSPSFDDLVGAIQKHCPEFFPTNAKLGRVVVTEFGKALVTKCAIVAAKIEDVFPNLDKADSFTAIAHAGADLFLRTAYCPTKFVHRLSVLDGKSFSTKTGSNVTVSVVGPLCFSGDVLAKDGAFPKPDPGDYVLALDAGANTISIFSRHCSRQAPPVYGIRRVEDSSTVKTIRIKEMESYDDVMSFWR